MNMKNKNTDPSVLKSKDIRAALIRSGMESMTKHGYISSNLESVLKKEGIPKGSFYYYFKSKEDFGREVISCYASFFAYKLDKYLLNESVPSPVERLKLFYEDARQGMAKYHFERGCLIGELMQEESLLPDGYNAVLNEILTLWQDKVARCLEQAQQIKEIKQGIDCWELAYFFWIGWEGAVMRAKLVKDPQPLDIFIKLFFAGIDQ